MRTLIRVRSQHPIELRKLRALLVRRHQRRLDFVADDGDDLVATRELRARLRRPAPIRGNLPTSSLSRSLSPDSDLAAASTWAEADPISLAPRCTSAMLEETCCVPCAACCTLREISCVAAPCSSIADVSPVAFAVCSASALLMINPYKRGLKSA
jgi:hypothetical protein